MNLLKILIPVAKLLPFTQPETKPKTSGEIYYLWESLSGGYKIISILETYQMNTEDSELHLLIGGMINSIYDYRIKRIGKALKNEGFTVPPQPGTKIYRGKPGVGQEVKLSDDEVIRNILTWAQFGLSNDARAVGAASSEDIRKIFISLLFEDMKAYSNFLDLGNSRHIYHPPPSATSAKDSLNIDEVARLWEELGARHITITSLETFYMNTNDKELNKLLLKIIKDVAYPQMKQLEDVLKKKDLLFHSDLQND
jgi:hypothetical protein